MRIRPRAHQAYRELVQRAAKTMCGATRLEVTTSYIDDAHPDDGGGAYSPPAAVVVVDI
jgi:hypothetical protein